MLYLTWGVFIRFFSPSRALKAYLAFCSLPLFGFTRNVGAPCPLKSSLGWWVVDKFRTLTLFHILGLPVGRWACRLDPERRLIHAPEMALQVSSYFLIHSSWCVELTLGSYPFTHRVLFLQASQVRYHIIQEDQGIQAIADP